MVNMNSEEVEFEIDRLQACCEEYRATIEEFTLEAGLAKERFDAVYEQVEQFEELANANKIKAAEMQLVAGRYQFMHEEAQKALNKVDDLFEYAYLSYDLPVLQSTIRKYLAIYTEAVSKVPTPPQKMVDIVFDGPPGPEAGRFVEVEDTETRKSVSVGTWVERDDGYWALRLQWDDK